MLTISRVTLYWLLWPIYLRLLIVNKWLLWPNWVQVESQHWLQRKIAVASIVMVTQSAVVAMKINVYSDAAVFCYEILTNGQ